MIKRDLVLTINNNVATLNQPVTVYSFDRGIRLELTVREYKFITGQVVEENFIQTHPGIVRARALIKSPDGKLFKYPDIRAEVTDDKVIVLITINWTDEYKEIGKHYIQIHLYDTEDSRVTLPPFYITVERLLGYVYDDEDDSDIASDIAITDKSPAGGGVIGYDKPVKDDSNIVKGFYDRNYWQKNTIILPGMLNKVETRLDEVYYGDGLRKTEINELETNAKTTIDAINELVLKFKALRLELDNYIEGGGTGGGSADRIPPITAIDIVESSRTISVGQTHDIDYLVVPSIARNKVGWESSDNSKCTVSSTGKIKGISEGTVTVKCYSIEDPSIYDTITINVEAKVVELLSIYFDKDTYTLNKSETEQLIPMFLPANATYKEVIWSSSSSNVTVDNSGLITAVSKGNATITCESAKYPGVKATANIKVVSEPKTITITNPLPSRVDIGHSVKLNASVSPSDSDFESIVWKSSDPSIATVDSEGNVNVISKGSFTISCYPNKYNNINDSTSSIVNVYPESIRFEVNTLEIDKNEVKSVNLIIEPEDYNTELVISGAINTKVGFNRDNLVSTASINKPLYIKGLSKGTDTIKVIAFGRADVNSILTVNVNPIIESLSITSSTNIFYEKETLQLDFTWVDSTLPKPTVTWSSDNESVATVDQNGLVTGVSGGSTTIRCSYSDTVSDEFNIEVKGLKHLRFKANNSGSGYVKINGNNILLTSMTLENGIYSYEYKDDITSINFGYYNNSSDKSICCDITELIELDSSKITNMSYMFYACSSLTTLPESLNTSNATNMEGMFRGCTKLTTIPKFNTSKVQNMYAMFYGCTKLSRVPDLVTSNVTNMRGMFYSCSSLESIPNFDTSKLTTAALMFYYCTSLSGTVNSNKFWNISTITSHDSCFSNCISLDNYYEVPTDWGGPTITITGNSSVDKNSNLQLSYSINPSGYKPSVTWSSSDNSIATVNSSGLVTGISKGSVSIRCGCGNTFYNEKEITVNPIYESLSITGGSIVDKNSTLQLDFTWVDSTLPKPTVTWSSDNTSVATVDQTGLVTGKSDGNATITCRYNGSICATKTIAVNPILESISITGNSSVDKNSTLQLGFTWVNSTLPKPSVTWSSSNTSVATVDQTGLVTGKAKGTATITCRHNDNIKSTKTITVNPIIESISITGNSSVNKNSTLQLGFTWVDSTLSKPSVTWSSSNTSVATVSSSGLVTGKSKGSATITCRYNSSVYATKTITVNPIYESMSITGSNIVDKNSTLQLGFTWTDSTLSKPSVTWSSSNTSVATVSSSGLVTGVSKGSTTITCRYNSSIYATKSITVNPIIESISITGDNNVDKNSNLQLDFTWVDSTLSKPSVTWSSSNTSVATVSSSGLVTGKLRGEATITCRYNSSVYATKTITVNPIYESISIIGSNSVDKNSTLQLDFTWNDSDVLSKPVVEWISNDSSIATIDINSGLLRGLSKGDVNITCWLKGTYINTSITVTVNPIIESITITGDSSVDKNSTLQLDFTWTDSTLSKPTVTWSSSNNSIATVDQNGLVTGVGKGSATIRCDYSDNVFGEYDITVNPIYETITIIGDSLVYKNSTLQLGFTWNDSDLLSKPTVTWSSSNTSIAAIDQNGLVTGINEGTANIRCAYNDIVYGEFNIEVSYKYLRFKANNDNGDGYVIINGNNVLLTDMILENGVYSYKYDYDITSIIFSKFDYTYGRIGTCDIIELIELDASKLNSMSYIFSGCTSLTNIVDLETLNVTDMYMSFSNCTSLTTIPQLVTSNVTRVSYMFEKCTSMSGYADPDKYWNNSNITNYSSCFKNCTKLTNYSSIPSAWK